MEIIQDLPNTLLSGQEFNELLLLSQEGDEEALQTLVYYNLRLVLKIVHRFKNKGYEMEDLFQIGTIGLLKALKNFDSKRGVKFSTYAVPLIIGEIMRYLRDDSVIKVSRSIQNISRKIKDYEEKFQKEHGRRPRISEVSWALNISPEEMVAAVEGVKRPVSIQQSVDTGDGEKDLHLFDQLADPSISRDEILDRIDLMQVLELLSQREKKILYLRFFQEKTQEEIGEIVGLSQVQISRLERKILADLKKHLTVKPL